MIKMKAEAVCDQCQRTEEIYMIPTYIQPFFSMDGLRCMSISWDATVADDWGVWANQLVLCPVCYKEKKESAPKRKGFLERLLGVGA